MSRKAGWNWPYRPTNPYRKESTGEVRLVTYMDEETYQDIDAAAKANNCSLSAQTRVLIEIGLETLKLEAAE